MSYEWTEKDKLFEENVYNNNIQYVKNEWMNIDESLIQQMFITAAKTNGIDDQSVFMFLDQVWEIDKTYFNSQMDDEHNCLFAACKYNNRLEMIKYLIEDIGMDPHEKFRYNDCTCFQVACESNSNMEIIKYLAEIFIKHSVLVSASEGLYSLTDGLEGGDTDVNSYLEYLCGNKNLNYETFLYVLELVECSIHKCKNNDIYHCLYSISRNDGCINIFKHLIKIGNYTSANTVNGLLMDCVKYNKKTDKIKYLVECLGADPYYLDVNGDNCLTGGCWKNDNLEVIKYLINDLKMETSHRDHDGNDCFMAACLGNLQNIDVIKFLVSDVSININETNRSNVNGLTIVLRRENLYPYCDNKASDEIIEYLVKETDIQIDLIAIINWCGYDKVYQVLNNIDMNDIIKINSTVQHSIDRINCLDKTQQNLFSRITMDMINTVVKKSNINPFILNQQIRESLNIDPMSEYNYNQCVKFMDELKYQIHVSKNKTNSNVSNVSSVLESDGLSESLFENNGSTYYGNRNIVYNAMQMFNDMSDMIEHSEIVELEGKLSKIAINQYIDSCYSNTLKLHLVPKEDFIPFIKFIDQYPTIHISVNQIEDQIIQYIDTNHIAHCEYLKSICKKYQLKWMYLDMHNKSYSPIV